MTINATCEANGEEKRVCSLDSAHKETRVIQAKGHEYGEWNVTINATCEANGEETRVCSLDSAHKETRVIQAKGHNYGEWNVTISATCETNVEETRICSLDNAHKETRVIQAKGHEYGEWNVTINATCEANGEETRVCSLDSAHKETRVIQAKGHTLGEWEIVVSPTCTLEGEKVKKCTVCSVAMETQIIEPLGHNYGEWIQAIAPSCITSGEETRTCFRDSSHKEVQIITALGHDYGDWIQTIAPTCTAVGEEERVCGRNSTHRETQPISPLGHNFGAWVVTTPPTTTVFGEETRVCKNNNLHKETRQLDKLPIITEDIFVVNGIFINATDKVNSSIQLNVNIKYIGESSRKAICDDVTFVSNNHLVATVDINGLITIKAPGSVEIYVESVYSNESGVKVRKTITLNVKHSPITELNLLTRDSYSMVRGLNDSTQLITGDNAQIELTLKYYEFSLTGATSADVTFASNDENVASVDENGLISFNGLGTCIITIASKHEQQDGGYMTKTIDVEVKMPVNDTELEISWFKTEIINGEIALKYKIKNICSYDVEARTIKVYFVNENGKVLGTDNLPVSWQSIAITIPVGTETEEFGVRGDSVVPNGTRNIIIHSSAT